MDDRSSGRPDKPCGHRNRDMLKPNRLDQWQMFCPPGSDQHRGHTGPRWLWCWSGTNSQHGLLVGKIMKFSEGMKGPNVEVLLYTESWRWCSAARFICPVRSDWIISEPAQRRCFRIVKGSETPKKTLITWRRGKWYNRLYAFTIIYTYSFTLVSRLKKSRHPIGDSDSATFFKDNVLSQFKPEN